MALGKIYRLQIYMESHLCCQNFRANNLEYKGNCMKIIIYYMPGFYGTYIFSGVTHISINRPYSPNGSFDVVQNGRGSIAPLWGLAHWGRVTYICVGKLTIIGSDNGLSPGPRQAIIWTNAGMLLIGPLGTNFSEILIEIYTFSFKKVYLKMSPGKRRSFCLGLNVLT